MALNGFKPIKSKYSKPPENLQKLKQQADEINLAYRALTKMPNLLSPTWRFDTLDALRSKFGQTHTFVSLEHQIEKHFGIEGLRLFLAVRTMADEIYRIESGGVNNNA